MIEADPRKRICAQELVFELSQLTAIWKNQMSQHFFKPIRKKNSFFTSPTLTYNTHKQMFFGSKTNIENSVCKSIGTKRKRNETEHLTRTKNSFLDNFDLIEKKPVHDVLERSAPNPTSHLVQSQTFTANVFKDFSFERRPFAESAVQGKNSNSGSGRNISFLLSFF